jgi:hypothetical protein
MSPSVAGPISTGPAGTALDQADTAQDQRAHDALAKVGFGNQQRTQFVRSNQQRLDIALGIAVDQRTRPDSWPISGKELTGPLIEQWRDVAKPVAQRDRDMARQHHEHAGTGLAGLEQRFAMPKLRNSPNRRMRSISCGVNAGNVCAWRGNEKEPALAPCGCRVVCTHLAIQKTRARSGPAGARGIFRLSARRFFA